MYHSVHISFLPSSHQGEQERENQQKLPQRQKRVRTACHGDVHERRVNAPHLFMGPAGWVSKLGTSLVDEILMSGEVKRLQDGIAPALGLRGPSAGIEGRDGRGCDSAWPWSSSAEESPWGSPVLLPSSPRLSAPISASASNLPTPPPLGTAPFTQNCFPQPLGGGK